MLESYGSLLEEGWQPLFAQARSHHRALEHALAWPALLGDRTVSRTVCALGRSDPDWSADYKLFSRSDWSSQTLFDPVLDDYLERYPKGPMGAAFDDSKLAKTGKKIPGACWQRDPLSPPFHVNWDRWQIEVNHRDEKSLLDIGQAQVRSPLAVPRHPAFAVACYSLLLLAGLPAFGPGRAQQLLPLPKWRTQAKRASLLDLLTLLRQEINETPVSHLLDANFSKNLTRYAYT